MDIDTLTLEQLSEHIETALDALTERQRRFALQLIDGGANSATEAIRRAGFSPGTQPQQIKRVPEVVHAMQLLRRRQELRIGIDVARKRQVLLEIAGKHKDETPSASVSAIKTLNDMDGDNAALKIQHGGQVHLVPVNYQLDTGRVLEHDPGPNPLLELITDEAERDHSCDHEMAVDDLDWLK